MRFKALLILVLAVLAERPAQGQILSRGNLFGPGAPPPLVGLEVGLGKHAQQGTFIADCNCLAQDGTGTGFMGALVFELPIDYEWAIGLKGGIDFRNTTSNSNVVDVAVISDENGGVDTLTSLRVNRQVVVKATYLAFTPYVQYQFFRMGPFVQVGPSIGLLMGNDFTQTRQLLETSATVNGKNYPSLRFQSNGTTEEPVESGPIADASSMRIGLVLSAGYNVAISERSILSPLLTYDFPLTTIRTTNASGWKIGSLYASAVLKFRLD